MSITDRITGIAKSYYHSAKDELEEGWEDISNLYERGELTEQIKKKVADLKNSSSKTNENELSDEEVQQILNSLKNNEYQSNIPKQKKKSSKLDLAYIRLNVTESTHIDLIEKAYKKAMKKYHPDRYATQPAKLKSATKVAQMITEAYDTIKKSRR